MKRSYKFIICLLSICIITHNLLITAFSVSVGAKDTAPVDTTEYYFEESTEQDPDTLQAESTFDSSSPDNTKAEDIVLSDTDTEEENTGCIEPDDMQEGESTVPNADDSFVADTNINETLPKNEETTGCTEPDDMQEGDSTALNVDDSFVADTNINEILPENEEITDPTVSGSDTDTIVCSSSSTGVTDTIERDDGVWFWPAASSGIYYSDYAGCLGDEYHSNQTPHGHNGVDFSNGADAVYAARSGTFYCNNVNYDNRGIYAVIEHPIENSDYSYYSIYQHLSEGSVLIANGTEVYAGQQIATSGNTGGSITTYGVHLHFGIIIAPKGQGTLISAYTQLNNIENNGWVYNSSIPSGGGRIVPNPKDTNDPSWEKIPDSKLAGFTASMGSVTYTFDPYEAEDPPATDIPTKRLDIKLNGGKFEEDSSLYKGTAAAFSDTYVAGSSIICATAGKNITLTSYASAISVDRTGKVVGALKYKNSGTLQVLEGGFVIAAAYSADSNLYTNIWNAAYNFENGSNRYVWYDSSTRKVYISSRYIDYGAYTGNMYTTADSIGITERIPVKNGFVFGGWRSTDGTVYPGNNRVDLSTRDITTLTAIWNEE